MEVSGYKCKKRSQWLRITLFCTFISFTFISNGQQTGISEKFKDKLELADKIRSSHRDNFNNLIYELEENYQSLTEHQQFYFNYLKGYQKVIAGELAEAIELLDSTIGQNKSIFLKHRAIITKVNAYTLNENYQEGFTVLNEMLPMLDNMRNKETLHQALFVVSLFYNRLSQYQLSKKYVSRLLNDNPSARNSCVASMLSVEASYRLNELTQQELDESFVELCRRENEFIASGIIYSFAARWYLINGDKKRSLEVLLDNLTATESTKYYLLIATYYSLIAETYYELDNFPLAQKYALLVLNKTTKEHKSEAIVRATKVLYLINKNSGDYEKALEHHELYQRQHLLINDDRNKRSISYQIAQKENREKSHEISLLAEKNKRLNVEKALFEQSAKSQQLQILLLSSVIIWLVYWAFRSYRVQSKLRNIADHDELTGIFNRRCFHELADSALKYCNKTNQPVSLLMFDLDHFKGINDQYGHHVGDWALKSTVDACKVLCRKNDIIGRFGGEEFTILLPGCANEKARELAEIYRHAIESISTEELGLDFNISASFGVFSSQKPSDTLTDVIKAADCAMYYSKQQGRNRVSVYGIDINSKSVGIN